MTAQTPSKFRPASFFSAARVWLFLPMLALAMGCVFLDDDPTERGYTECGSFLGGETCSPGQYCEDPSWSECALGCLSDVNCASNQYCAKTGSQEAVGVCQNIRTTVTPALSTDAGFSRPDAFYTPDAVSR